jgi:hypothetical protein
METQTMMHQCEFCGSYDTIEVIYGETGKHSWRCSTHLKQPQDYQSNPPRTEEYV